MKRRAFTLVELFVVIAILGLLSTVVVASMRSSRTGSRNAMRKVNLVQIQKALDLYFANYNAYPNTSTTWQGTCSYYGSFPDAYVDETHDAWIPGLTPTYMESLPHDPNTNKLNPSSAQAYCRTNAARNCYVYASNSVDYKIVAMCVPEGTIASNDPFYDLARPFAGYQISTPGAAAW